jgi:outer membrane protein TolC
MLVTPIHAIDQSAFVFDRTLIQSQTVLGFTLFDGGERSSEIDRARAGVELADARGTVVEAEVIEQVTAAYLRALTAKEIDDAQATRLTALEAEHQRVELLLQEGRAAQVELLRIRAALAEAQADRVTTTMEVENAGRDVARLIGVAPIAASRLTTISPAVRERAPRAELSARAQAINPQIQQAQQAVAAEQAGYRAAKASWLPKLNVGATLFTFGSANGNFSAEWQARVGVSYPIFTGLARSNRIAESNARQETATSELRLLELQLENLVDRAIAAIEEADARADALSQAVEHLTEVSRIEQLALEVGTGVQTDFLRAEADLFATRAQLVRANYNGLAARVALARAVGALSAEWIALHLESGS